MNISYGALSPSICGFGLHFFCRCSFTSLSCGYETYPVIDCVKLSSFWRMYRICGVFRLIHGHQTDSFCSYPLTYCLCILPVSIVRWIGFIQEKKYNRNDIPSAASFFAVSIFGLSGFLNVVLLLSTRPNSGLFGKLVFEPARRPPSTVSLPDQYQLEANGVTEERREEPP